MPSTARQAITNAGSTILRFTPILASIGLLVGLTLMGGGCQVDEMITVSVPPQTREHLREDLGVSVPPEVSLRDARLLRTDGDRRFKQDMERRASDHAASNDALDAEIADGSFVESLVGSAVNTGIEMGVPYLGTVPGGAILATMLTGLGMWFVPRPGEKGRLQVAKDEAKEAEDRGYDMGRAEAVSTIRDAQA